MAANAPMMVRATMVDGDADGGVLPTGQAAGMIDDLPTVDHLVTGIIDQTHDILEQLWRSVS